MVGDGYNDLEALRAVGFPVAMGNAEPAVRAAARLQVGHVDQGGLVEAIAAALRGVTREVGGLVCHSPGLKTNGYETITTPPPTGWGNSQRRTPWTRHSPRGDSPSSNAGGEAATSPVAAMVNSTSTRPASCGWPASSRS